MLRRRIEYPGAFYHVVQRGNNQEKIFLRDADKYRYMNTLVELKKKYNFKLFGYVLMDNHYHLLLQTFETPLSKIIFRQNMLYSRYFNKTHNRSGHLYGGRYKAYLIDDECYLFSVLRYIHWNPVRAGICANPENYLWSSDYYYRNIQDGVIDIDFILGIINPNRKASISKYINLMKVEEAVGYEEWETSGDKKTVETKKKPAWQLKSERQKDEICKSLDQILNETGVSDSDYTLIKNGSRKRHLVKYKSAYCIEAVRQGYTYGAVGANIGITGAAVAKLLSVR